MTSLSKIIVDIDDVFKTLYDYVDRSVVGTTMERSHANPSDPIFKEALLRYAACFGYQNQPLDIQKFALHIRSTSSNHSRPLYQRRHSEPRWKYAMDFYTCLHLSYERTPFYSRDQALDALMELASVTYSIRMEEIKGVKKGVEYKPFKYFDTLPMISCRSSNVLHSSTVDKIMKELYRIPAPWVHFLALNCPDWIILQQWKKDLKVSGSEALNMGKEMHAARFLISFLTVPFYYLDTHESLLNIYCVLVHAIVDRLMILCNVHESVRLLPFLDEFRLWPVVMKFMVPLWHRCESTLLSDIPSTSLPLLDATLMSDLGTIPFGMLRAIQQHIDRQVNLLSKHRKLGSMMGNHLSEIYDHIIQYTEKQLQTQHPVLFDIVVYAHMKTIINMILDESHVQGAYETKSEYERRIQEKLNNSVEHLLSDPGIFQKVQTVVLKNYFKNIFIQKK